MKYLTPGPRRSVREGLAKGSLFPSRKKLYDRWFLVQVKEGHTQATGYSTFGYYHAKFREAWTSNYTDSEGNEKSHDIPEDVALYNGHWAIRRLTPEEAKAELRTIRTPRGQYIYLSEEASAEFEHKYQWELHR